MSAHLFDIDFEVFTVDNGGIIEHAILPLRDQGLVQIRGVNYDRAETSNGSGKTTLFDLLSDSICGSGGKDASKNEYLPLRGGGNMVRVLKFRTRAGEYVARYYRKHKTEGTRTELFENGVDITPVTKIDDVHKLILEKTGLSEREWFGSVYLKQDTRHALVKGTPKERKDYLATHFGLNETDACIRVVTKNIGGIVLPDEAALTDILRTCEQSLASLPDADVLSAEITAAQADVALANTAAVAAGVEISNCERARGVEDQRNARIRDLAAIGYVLSDATKATIDGLRQQLQQHEIAVAAAAQIQRVQSQLDQLPACTDTADTVNARLRDQQQEVSRLNDLLTKLNARARVLTQMQAHPEVQASVDELQAVIASTTKDVSMFTARYQVFAGEISKLTQLQGKCSMCLRDIPDSERDALIETRRGYLQQYDLALPQLREQLAAATASLAAAQARAALSQQLQGLPDGDITETATALTQARESINALTSLVSQIQTRAALESQLQGIVIVREHILDDAVVARTRASIPVLVQAYEFVVAYSNVRFSEETLAAATLTRDAAVASMNSASARVTTAQSQLRERQHLTTQKQDIEAKLRRNTAEKQRKRVLEVLQVVFKDTRARSLRECSEMLSSALPLYVQQLFPGDGVSVELSEAEDSLDFFLKDSSVQIPMKLLSTGESRRVGLAIMFAFAKLGAKSANILIADEPYDGLDPRGRQCVYELFRDLGIPSIFITSPSNDKTGAHMYDRVFSMERRNGASRLVIP